MKFVDKKEYQDEVIKVEGTGIEGGFTTQNYARVNYMFSLDDVRINTNNCFYTIEDLEALRDFCIHAINRIRETSK